MIVDYELLDRIDRKKAAIENNPDYYLRMYRTVRRKLKHSANIHSYWMENPDLRMKILCESGKKDSRELRVLAREGIERMFMAWDFLHNQVENSDDRTYVNRENIHKVGNYIEPKVNGGFRNGRVSLGLKYVPPNYLKVPDLIDSFCTMIRESDLHPIEVGINCHIHIAGIQPFFDGNKRTARIFQDTILYSEGYPPSILALSERTNYIDHLEEALLGIQENNLIKQRYFFNYIASNIDMTLDKIVKNMKRKKTT